MVIDATTKQPIVTDDVEFLHDYLPQPRVTHSNRIVYTLQLLPCALKDVPATLYHVQLEYPPAPPVTKPNKLHPPNAALPQSHWPSRVATTALSPPSLAPREVYPPSPRVGASPTIDSPAPRVYPTICEPVATRTRSRRITFWHEDGEGDHTCMTARRVPSKHMNRSVWALSVTDPDTGRTLEYRQL